MSDETFELLREDLVPALNLKIEDYGHKVTVPVICILAVTMTIMYLWWLF
jgi:hypothetical protein